MSVNSIFVDTNVLVYLFDTHSPDKQLQAQKLLYEERGRIAVSVQVLGEFYVTVTRKLATPLAPDIAIQAVDEFSQFQVHALHPELVRSAMHRSQSSRLSYWDSLIVETALSAGTEILYAEDLQDEQEIGDLQIINPFRHVR